MALRTPMFFKYFAQTYRLDSTPGGGRQGTILNLTTGLFEQDNGPIDEITRATSTSDIKTLTEERFVQETEAARMSFLRGDGPIFALYDTIRGIDALAVKEGRSRSAQETALVKALRTRTFKMWAEEADRRAAGAPPSFPVTSVAQEPGR